MSLITIHGDIPAERKAELITFSPWARFEIPSEKTEFEYFIFIHGLISEMLTKVDERNRWNCVSLDQQSGTEGGIDSVHLNGEFIVGCKLYWFNGEPIDTPCGWKKGCLFRDHENKSVYTVHQIFLLTDAFAEFLKQRQIPFQLFVRHRSGPQDEICRAKFPV